MRQAERRRRTETISVVRIDFQHTMSVNDSIVLNRSEAIVALGDSAATATVSGRATVDDVQACANDCQKIFARQPA